MKSYWRLPIPEATRQKFEDGRWTHGPEWDGVNPAAEAYGELLDTLSYDKEYHRVMGKHLPGVDYVLTATQVLQAYLKELEEAGVDLNKWDTDSG